VIGMVFAQWGTRLLVGQITTHGGPGAGGPLFLDLSLHWRVLLFTFAVTLVTTLLFGVVPALRAGRVPAYDAIKQHGPGRGGERSLAFGGPLVVTQVALSLVLLFAAGLFLRTFTGLAHRDLGFEAEGILLVNLDSQRALVTTAERGALVERAREAVAAVPGVSSASVSLVNPLSGMGWKDRFEVQGIAPPLERQRSAWVNAVTPGWFGTYGTPLRAGRDFQTHDRIGTPLVAIVNEAFVKRYLGGQNPLGRILLRQAPDRQLPPLEVVGLVKDAAYRSPRDPMEATVYLPVGQIPGDEMWPFATLAVRSASASPALLTRDVAAAIGSVDRNLSLTFRLFSDQVGASVMRERIVAWLSGFFGAIGLLLAAIGLYGVLS
jgi:predicted permease